MDQSAAYGLQQLLNTLQLAAFYAPLALAFALIQAVTRRIFLGFGDLAMFGSFAAIYTCYDAMVRGLGDLASGASGLLVAVICGAALGTSIARLMLSGQLLRHPLAFMIGSIGLAIFIQELMRLQSGGISVWIPPLLPDQSLVHVGGTFPIRIGQLNGWSALISATAVLAVCALLAFSPFGRHWRACAQHPRLAALCGVDAAWVAAASFALAGALAGVTGWTSAIVYGGAHFSDGLMAGFKAMFASVVGGFGTIRGAVAGAFVLAIAEVGWSVMFSTAYRDVAVFGLIVLMLVFRPEGLCGSTLPAPEQENEYK